MNQETISILTPSFQYAQFIEDAIISVRDQNVPVPVEHIVQDGGSNDGTVEVLRQYPNLLWRSEPDRGQSDALNLALNRSSGSIIGWLNADEFYLHGALARVADAFADPRVDAIYGDSVFVDPTGRLQRLVPHHTFDPFVLKYYGCYVPSCTFFVRRRLLDDVQWDTGCRYIMDWDLYLGLTAKGARFKYVPHPLGAFRVHDERVTAVALPKDDEERLSVMRRYGIMRSSVPRTMLRRGAARIRRIQLKTFSGAYVRQLRCHRAAGTDLRWWLSDP